MRGKEGDVEWVRKRGEERRRTGEDPIVLLWVGTALICAQHRGKEAICRHGHTICTVVMRSLGMLDAVMSQRG